MGAVYQGVRTTDGKRVAIKVLSAALAANPVSRERFLREARLTARVRHPNIVAVIDAGEDEGQAYLVMELLEGEDLASRLRAGPLTVADTADILVPVCDAIATAHREGITHRDLKPSNIFLATREGQVRPTVLDFGIAQDNEGVALPAAPTGQATPVVFGSPMYLAPELVADHRAAGPASDQYALGVILYESLTGEQPHLADDVPQLLRAIASGKPPALRERHPEIPAALEAIVVRAMSADPQARFSSVAELRRELLPFASPVTQAATPGRRRAPSSPAIEVEAATPSPFVRTLVPEAQAESGPWFVAPPSPEGETGDLPLPPLPPIPEHESHEDVVLTPRAAADLGRTLSAVSRAVGGRRRIVIAAAVAVCGVALLLLVRGGHSPAPPSPPVAIVPAPAPAPAPVAAAPPAPTPAPVAATPPPPAPPAPPPPPPAPVAASPPEPVAPPPPAPPPAPSPVIEPPPVPPVAAAPARPVPPPPPEDRPAPPARRERPASASTEPTAPAAPQRVRPPSPRPRVHENTDVRLHNGVPLLD